MLLLVSSGYRLLVKTVGMQGVAPLVPKVLVGYLPHAHYSDIDLPVEKLSRIFPQFCSCKSTVCHSGSKTLFQYKT